MAKQEFHLAGETYAVKARIKENVRCIAARSPVGEPLTGRGFGFMRDLFAYHPRAESKTGPGIETIVVRVAARNPTNKEFWIKRYDGDEFIDISWTECLGATPALAEFRNACRLAVKDVTQAYCDKTFDRAGREGLLRCPVTGELFSRETAHVDHDEPWPFRTIVDEFIRREGIDVHTVMYDGFEHGSTFITLRDQALTHRFVEFHNSVASLRVMSRAANLSRSRVNDAAVP